MVVKALGGCEKFCKSKGPGGGFGFGSSGYPAPRRTVLGFVGQGLGFWGRVVRSHREAEFFSGRLLEN